MGHLAVNHRLEQGSRAFSCGVVGLAYAGHALTLTLGNHDRSRAPSLQRFFLTAFLGTTNPSDSLPTLRDFSFVPYTRSLCLTGCRVGSLLFRTQLWKRATAYTPERSSVHPDEEDVVYCLRRDMTGSALSISFRLII